MIDWETREDLANAFAGAGVTISYDQLERWRGKGLLPKARQAGAGKGQGTIVYFPKGTAAQAIAIQRHLNEYEKLDYAGWRLWLEGFQVDDRYWRPHIEMACRNLIRVREFIQSVERRHERGTGQDTIYDKVGKKLLRRLPFYNPLSKLPNEIQASIPRVIAEIILGVFSTFQLHIMDDDGIKYRDTFLSGTGIVPHGKASRYSDAFDFKSHIESVLSVLSVSIEDISLNNANEVFPQENVRAEFLNVTGIATSLYNTSGSNFEQPKRSLKIAFKIISMKNPLIQATMLLIWDRYRKVSTNILSETEIEALYADVKKLRILSEAVEI